MRAALFLALIVSAAEAQPRVFDRSRDVASRRSSRGEVACGRSFAFFEMAPSPSANGDGFATACACVNPSAVNSVGALLPLTFTRASTAWCTKGNETTGIANGDLVECAADKARVGTGGSGALKLGIAAAATNVLSRSQQFDDTGAWSTTQNVAAPTVTANQATSPASTTTAERIQIPATTAAQYSLMRQAMEVGTKGTAVYIKGNGQSGTMDLMIASDIVTCGVCTYNPTTWTRCVTPGAATVGGVAFFHFGNDGLDCGGTARDAQDFFAWQADAQATEVGGTIGPPITTAGTAVARVAEVATFAVTLAGSTRSLSATWIPPSTFTAGRSPLSIYFDASNSDKLTATSTAATSTVTTTFTIATVASTKATTATMTASTAARVAGYYDGAARFACLDGTCVSTAGALTLPVGAATIYIGSALGAAGTEANGWVGGVRVDPVYAP